MPIQEPITPRVDMAFKKIFGVDENKDLLISLINSIVSEEDQVANVTLLNPYNSRDFKDSKLSILDIKAEGHTGKLYNIEIQINDDVDYDKRALFYWAELYRQQLKISNGYSKLNKAIGIHILNFTCIPETEKYHNSFCLLERESKIHYFKDIELHTIELNKFIPNSSKKYLNEAEELRLMLPKIKTALDKWAAFLTRYDLLKSKQLPNALKDENLIKAFAILEEMNFTKEEREAYEGHLKWLRMEISALKTAEVKGEKKGRVKGKEEGRIEGREEGRKEGREEGKAESKIEVAKDMLFEGCEIDFIAKITKLSEKKLLLLRDEMSLLMN